MDPQKKQLLLVAGVGIVVLFLFSRAKSSGGVSAAKTAAADPLQQAAQSLQLQKLQQKAQLDSSAAALAQQEANTLSQFNFFKTLAADPAYACPNGGRPRWIPGQGPGCIGPKTGGITLGGVLGSLAGAFGGATRAAGGGLGVPGIAGGRF